MSVNPVCGSTSKPFSTISYNSPEFLRAVLDKQVRLGNILYYMYILHEKDTDDKKNHIHVYIAPAERIKPNAEFSKLFYEIDPNNDIPLKCRPFMPSKDVNDWLLYCIHDPEYLNYKGLTRNTFYSYDDIYSSDQDVLDGFVKDMPVDVIPLNPARIYDIIVQKQFLNYSQLCIYLHKHYPLAFDWVRTHAMEINLFINSCNIANNQIQEKATEEVKELLSLLDKKQLEIDTLKGRLLAIESPDIDF